LITIEIEIVNKFIICKLRLKRHKLYPLSLAQMIGHCIIYAGDRAGVRTSVIPFIPPLRVKLLAIRLLDIKKKPQIILAKCSFKRGNMDISINLYDDIFVHHCQIITLNCNPKKCIFIS
jgi:hypothetical protein